MCLPSLSTWSLSEGSRPEKQSGSHQVYQVYAFSLIYLKLLNCSLLFEALATEVNLLLKPIFCNKDTLLRVFTINKLQDHCENMIRWKLISKLLLHTWYCCRWKGHRVISVVIRIFSTFEWFKGTDILRRPTEKKSGSVINLKNFRLYWVKENKEIRSLVP